jgi:hypothetical protein
VIEVVPVRLPSAVDVVAPLGCGLPPNGNPGIVPPWLRPPMIGPCGLLLDADGGEGFSYQRGGVDASHGRSRRLIERGRDAGR